MIRTSNSLAGNQKGREYAQICFPLLAASVFLAVMQIYLRRWLANGRSHRQL
jgi:hypothetical protein